MPPSVDAVTVWHSLKSASGLGATRLAEIAQRLAERRQSVSDLLNQSASALESLGLSPALADPVAQGLTNLTKPPEPPPNVAVITPDDERYPVERLDPQLPLPVVLYVAGNVSLLRAPGAAISGSRSAHEAALKYAFALAQRLAKQGLNVVSGHAAGIDEAAHLGSLEAGGTTTVVLAEGLGRFKPRASLRTAESDSIVFVSGFDPEARWTTFRAMERNSVIAALADLVVVISANLKGGSWEQAQLCLKLGKPLFVPDFADDVAAGNQTLIQQGAIPLDPTKPDDLLVQMESSRSQDRRQSATQLEFYPGP